MLVVKISSDSDGLSLIQLMRDTKKQITEDSLIYCVVFQVRRFINLISLPTLRIKRIFFNGFFYNFYFFIFYFHIYNTLQIYLAGQCQSFPISITKHCHTVYIQKHLLLVLPYVLMIITLL